MIDEMRKFLASRKVTEAFSAELRETITVPTGLESAVEAALGKKENVVIAGDAGSGKTHLLGNLVEKFRGDGFEVVEWEETINSESTSDTIRIIEDATEVLDLLDGDVLETSGEAGPVAVAINEGPLIQLAKDYPGSGWERALDMLRSMQRGVEPERQSGLPVVFNAAGYDPVAGDAVASILAIDEIHQVVEESQCGCDPAICPRRQSWRLLKKKAVRKRVNEVVDLANLHGQSVLFREIWNFVADLVLGGRCDESPGTSAWFWRVFNGDSELSRRIREAADPKYVVYPGAEAHLWYGDLTTDRINLVSELSHSDIDPPAGPIPYDEPSQYEWLKSELFFIVEADSMVEVLSEEVDVDLRNAVEGQRTEKVVNAINRYMTYGTSRNGSDAHELQLWTDLGIQKRLERVRGQVSLGRARTSSFKLRRSVAVGNHPDRSVELPGPRNYLVHQGGETSFLLTARALDLIKGGRSYRTSDRPHTDMEWFMTRFFIDVADALPGIGELQVLNLDFDRMEGERRRYSISRELNSIAPASD